MWRGETSDRGGKSYRSDVRFGEHLGGFVSRLCFSFSTSTQLDRFPEGKSCDCLTVFLLFFLIRLNRK